MFTCFVDFKKAFDFLSMKYKAKRILCEGGGKLNDSLLRANLVDEINHTSEYEYGTYSWDMLSKDGLEIAYGLYIYHVDAPNVGEKTGKFAVIK